MDPMADRAFRKEIEELRSKAFTILRRRSAMDAYTEGAGRTMRDWNFEVPDHWFPDYKARMEDIYLSDEEVERLEKEALFVEEE